MGRMNISTLCNSVTSKSSGSNAVVDHGSRSPCSEYSDEDFVVVDCRTSGNDALLPQVLSEPRFSRTQAATSNSVTEASRRSVDNTWR